jgi:NTP pyrophosphatase (non-canonical NTP hydrolase)
MVEEGNAMNLEDMIKQCVADSRCWFPDERAQALPNQALCLAGEVGEVANLVKNIVRGSLTIEKAMSKHYMASLDKDTLQEEVVDILIYLCNLMGNEAFKEVDWQAIWEEKRNFNEARFGARTTQRLPQQVLAEAGLAPEQRQNWQQEGDFAS